MTDRKELANGEYYHVYNRGVDKRVVFTSKQDINRFIKSLVKFNTKKPTGSLFRLARLKKSNLDTKIEPLVEIVAYCLNPNHYHLILRQVEEGGISEFMKRVNGGYTYYFNEQNDRSVALFQGRFKSKRIGADEYLKHLSVYISLNDKVHNVRGSTSHKSSWNEYIGKSKYHICKKDIVLDQFKTLADYKKFAQETLAAIKRNKDELREIEFEQSDKLIQKKKDYARKMSMQ